MSEPYSRRGYYACPSCDNVIAAERVTKTLQGSTATVAVYQGPRCTDHPEPVLMAYHENP